MTRSATQEIVLETIYRLAGVNAPSESAEATYQRLSAPCSLGSGAMGLFRALAVARGWRVVRDASGRARVE